jgi:hypothetical protein
MSRSNLLRRWPSVPFLSFANQAEPLEGNASQEHRLGRNLSAVNCGGMHDQSLYNVKSTLSVTGPVPSRARSPPNLMSRSRSRSLKRTLPSYVIRARVSAEDLAAANAVQAHKDLSRVEGAFRSIKTITLLLLPRGKEPYARRLRRRKTDPLRFLIGVPSWF